MSFKTYFSRIYFGICCALLILPSFFGEVYAAGLGKLTVFSGLGQPLRAEIELTSVSKNELGTLKIKLASAEAFQRANLEFNPALQSARFTLGQRDARYFVTIASSQVMNEPFVSMLLELNWNEGRLLREYTFLLDPIELKDTPAAQGANSNEATSNAASNQNAGNRVDATEQSDALKTAKAEKVSKAEKAEKTLNQEKIAKKPKAIQAPAIAKSPLQLAPTLVPSFIPANTEKSIAKDKKANKPDGANPAPANEAEDKLQVSRGLALALSLSLSPSPSSGSTTSTRSQATPRVEEKSRIVMPEDKIAKDKMIAEATARIQELEKNVSDLQKFVQAKSKELVNSDGNNNAQQQPMTDVTQTQTGSVIPVSSVLPTFLPPAAISATSTKSVWADQIFVREWMGDLRFISAALVLLIAVIAGGVSFLRSRRKTDDFASYAAGLVNVEPSLAPSQNKHHAVNDVANDVVFKEISLASNSATTPQFDFSSINLDLDLDKNHADDVIDTDKEILNQAGNLNNLNNAKNADHSSIDMKLDLALAYDSIGDKQGARELLDEVIKHGSAEQVAKASAMLKKLVR